MWVRNIINNPKELEQRILSILASTPGINFGQTESMDFSAKDLAKNGIWESALEESLVAARSYDMFGPDYDLERAYCLDRASKCMSKIAEMDRGYDCIHRVCAETRETAAQLFEKSGGRHISDAGFAFLRSAMSYVLAQDIKKALANARKSFGCNASLSKGGAFKIATLMEEAGDLAYGLSRPNSRSQECHVLYAETRETAAGIFMTLSSGESGYHEEAGFAFLKAAGAFSSTGDTAKASELLKKSDSAFGYVGYSHAALFIRDRLFPNAPMPANKP